MARRVAFMGSPAFAVPSLRALHAAGHDITAVYTQPPRPAGRGQKEQKTPVHVLAEELGLGAKVRHPQRLRGEDLEAALALEAEVFCVVAYGLLLPKALVDAKVCLNVHPSRLPRWRGAAPIQHTLMAGDTETEVCIMRLDEGMDTGPVYDRVPLAVGENMTAGELHDACAATGAERLVAVVARLGDLQPVAQEGQPTLAFKITAQTRRIDWRRSAAEVHNLVRAMAPTPGAMAEAGGETVKVLATEKAEGTGKPGEIVRLDGAGVVVACGEGAVRIVTLQRPGKVASVAADVARGWDALAAGRFFS